MKLIMYAIDNKEDLKGLKELASLQNRVKDLRLQEKFGSQYFFEDLKEVFEPFSVTDKQNSEEAFKKINGCG